MRFRAKLGMLVGVVLGGLVGWLAFAWSRVRDDPAEGVGHVLIGAVWGFGAAVAVLTRGTFDLRSLSRAKQATPDPNAAARGAPSSTGAEVETTANPAATDGPSTDGP